MASPLESYWSLFSRYSGKKNFHTGGHSENIGLSSIMLPSHIKHDERCSRQRKK
jgi:hypothetical protein